MKVLKFGGTSVGSIEAIKNLKSIVQGQDTPLVVVVSAFSGVTDQILKMSSMAAMGDDGYQSMLSATKTRHLDVIAALVPQERKSYLNEKTHELIEQMSRLLQGVLLVRDLSQKTENMLLSYGERLSSLIIAEVIEQGVCIDTREIIKTNPYFGKSSVDFDITNSLITERLSALSGRIVVGGFISSDATTGETTTLGRGGSDYTAAIIAAAMNASVLEIWTDVDGFMTADPNVISNAYVIEKISYIEAMELCNFGAKVIYPPTIFPVYHKQIPIRIKNTFNPASPGTYIAKRTGEEGQPTRAIIKGISSINDTTLITVEGLGMVGIIGVNYRIFKALSKAGISVFFVSQASSENTTSIGVSNSIAAQAVSVLREEFAQEIAMGEIHKIKSDANLATVAIVGQGMKGATGVAGKLFGTLGRNGINVVACAQGASETNISFVVSTQNLRKSLNVIHDSFFLSEYQELNLFIVGVGTVGANLIDQILGQQKQLLRKNALKLNVVGISNSRRAIFSREGIDLTTYKEQLENSQMVSSPQTLKEQIIGMNIFNSVFVDCTASDQIPPLYHDIINSSISVVTANKIAASGKYESYEQLKENARTRGVKFLFETNVGAGLPIINTINDLRNSGDKIIKLEAVLSGTLNYIFNEISSQVPLSETIRRAKAEGYSEPDPRLDLSGMDVMRKIVILSREAGYRVEIDDVEKRLFVPQKYFDGSIDDFWATISQLDEQFEQDRQRIEREGKRWRFVASLDSGKMSVGLKEVDSSDPLFHLEGSNNVILITTDRYREYPLMIKGYGAGASVTAAGVFADVMSIANIR